MNKINEYICINLNELKKTNPEYYDRVYNILTFIYKDIDKEFLSKERERLFMETWLPRIDSFSNYKYGVDEFKKEKTEIFNNFVNGESCIIETLFDMCKCNDKRFANKFFESIEMPIKMFRDGINYETRPISYIFNLYTMLTAYRMNKNDYGNFLAVVEDSKYSFSEEKYYYDSRENCYTDKKRIIDSILENKDYQNLNGLRNILKTILYKFGSHLDSKDIRRYKEIISSYNKLNSAIIQAKKENKVIDEKTIKEIILDLNSFSENKEASLSTQEMYFEKVLLFNNRYQFIKERLPKLDNNITFKKQVASYLADMDINFFEYINSLNIYYEDSFVEMMKLVFDSDSFKSVFSRLNAIKRASKNFVDGNKEEMLQIIKELPTSKHNSYHGMREIVLNQQNNNITKPESISERMVLYYQINFGLGKNPDCLRKYRNNQYAEISDFVSDLQEEVNKTYKAGIESIEPEEKPKKNLLSIFK